MGNCCSCNWANKINAINVTLLCAVACIMYFWEFHDAFGLKEDTCQGVDSKECHGRAASGALTLIAGIVALLGGCSSNPERNQATVSAAFGLINLAQAVNWWADESGIEDHLYFSGVSNVAGFISGIGFSLYTCKSGYQKNNFLFITSIFLYAFAFVINSWKSFDNKGCSADDFDPRDPNNDPDRFIKDFEDADSCTMIAFQGIFALLSMLFTFFALCQVCCQKTVQPRTQSFVICCSIGWLFAFFATSFWFNFGNAKNFGEQDCNTDDPTNSNSNFCTTMFFGGFLSIIGLPLSLAAGLMFCFGCITREEDERPVVGKSGNYVLMNV